MADEIVAKYLIDVSGAAKALDALVIKLDATGKKLDDSFIGGAASVKTLQAELAKQPKTIAELEKRLAVLNKLLKEDAKVGSDGFNLITKAINETNEALKRTNGELEQVPKKTNFIVEGFKKVGAAMLAAFAADRIVEFAKEAVELAAKAEGVERAFKRVGSAQLLDGLRSATRGTVNDLTLMTTAVQASNFKIPLENLAKYMEFANARARETGKSVDYLVESILTGVGRGSIEVWDNMGISISDVRSRLNGVSIESLSVAERSKLMSDIVTEELAKMGTQATTTAEKIDQIKTAFDNFKVAVGKEIITQFTDLNTEIAKTGELLGQSGIDGASVALKGLGLAVKLLLMPFEELNWLIQKNAQIFAYFKSLFGGEELETGSKQLTALQNGFAAIRKTIDENNKAKEQDIVTTKAQIENVFYYTEAIKKLDEKIKAEGTAVADILPLMKQRAEMQEKLTALTTEETFGISLLNTQIGVLKKQLDNASIGGGVFWNILEKLDAKIKELTEAQAMAKLSEALIPDEEPESKDLNDKIAAELTAENEMLDGKKAAHEEFNKWQSEELEGQVQAQLDADAAAVASAEESDEKKRLLFEGLANATLQLTDMITGAIIDGYQRELEGLDEKLRQGFISEEEYDRKKRELLTKQNDAAKQAAIFGAIINTALAISSALTAPPPISFVLAALAGALGAVQIGIIASQPTPQFAKGVVDLQGEGTATSDSIHAKLSKGESVITAKETSKHRGLLEAMNKGLAEKYILSNYVKPALDSAMLSGFADIGKSAEVNGLTANLKDHNIIAAMDRHRAADVAGFKMLAAKLDRRQPKRGGYA